MIEALEDRGKGNQKYGKARRVEDVLRKLWSNYEAMKYKLGQDFIWALRWRE